MGKEAQKIDIGWPDETEHKELTSYNVRIKECRTFIRDQNVFMHSMWGRQLDKMLRDIISTRGKAFGNCAQQKPYYPSALVLVFYGAIFVFKNIQTCLVFTSIFQIAEDADGQFFPYVSI